MRISFLSKSTFFTTLVAGNLLGVGVLALPIKIGLSGFIPSIVVILLIWLIMLLGGFIIADRIIGKSKHYNLPSFFSDQLGPIGHYISVICNLIILYGVITAYISGIAVVITELYHITSYSPVIQLCYAACMFALVLGGVKILRSASFIIVSLVLLCFVVLIFSGMGHFSPHLLTKTHWSFFMIGMPVAISAFHYQNIIPTVVHHLDHDRRMIRKVLLRGMLLGLLVNGIWLLIILGSLPTDGAGIDIYHAYKLGEAANVPLEHLLHSPLFKTSSVIFALLAVSASFLANGRGLYDFVADLCYSLFNCEHKAVIASVAFMPPLLVAMVYPHIFLSALDVVGGIGEVVLFVMVPAWIMLSKRQSLSRRKRVMYGAIFTLGLLVALYVLLEKLGLAHQYAFLAPFFVH